MGRRRIATAGSAPRASTRSAAPDARSGPATWSGRIRRRRAAARTAGSRTPRTPTSCSTTAPCSRSGTSAACPTASTRAASRRSARRTLAGSSSGVSAHAKVDAATGELLFFDYATQAPYLVHHVVSASGELRALDRDRGARAAATPRHGLHRALLDPDGPAALLGSAAARAQDPSARLPPGAAEPLRRAAARRRPGALVRGRARPTSITSSMPGRKATPS